MWVPRDVYKRQLTDYAMKLNYGAEQQLVTTEIVAL